MSDTDELGGPINHHDELDQWVASLPNSRGRKLTLSEKCGIAWALKKGAPITAVCDAFALSRATVSWLKHCLQPDGRHYAEVFRELQRLGPDAFKDKYYTPELHGRLKRIALDLPRRLDENQTDRAPHNFGPDLNAAKYEGPFTMSDNSQWTIGKNPEGLPLGWYYKLDSEDVWHGQEGARRAEGHEPYASSSLAFDGAYEFWGFPSPRRKTGPAK